MAWDMKPGMKVICIFDEWKSLPIAGMPPASGLPVKGCIYTISDIRRLKFKGYRFNATPIGGGPSDPDILMLSLFEFGKHNFYFPDCFKPTKDTSIAVFEALLAPTPKILERT